MTHQLAANFTTAVAKLRQRGEAGATALEYAGMILVAALVVSAIFAAISGVNVGSKVKTAVEQILPGA
jgi:Flp pilus assembly pilin Flp